MGVEVLRLLDEPDGLKQVELERAAILGRFGNPPPRVVPRALVRLRERPEFRADLIVALGDDERRMKAVVGLVAVAIAWLGAGDAAISDSSMCQVGLQPAAGCGGDVGGQFGVEGGGADDGPGDGWSAGR